MSSVNKALDGTSTSLASVAYVYNFMQWVADDFKLFQLIFVFFGGCRDGCLSTLLNTLFRMSFNLLN